MSVRFTGTGTYIRRVTGPEIDNFSLTCWVKLYSNNSYAYEQNFVRVYADDGSLFGGLGYDNQDPSYRVVLNNAAHTTCGGAYVSGDWYFGCFYMDSTYWGGDVLAEGESYSVVTRPHYGLPTALVEILFGEWSTGNWFDYSVANVKVWSGVVLNSTQFEAERYVKAPAYASNVWATWWLDNATDLADHSGNGRDLSATGSNYATDSSDPPWAATGPDYGTPYDHEGVKPWSSIWRPGRI